ncbi:MAG: hypothetical protein ABL997_20565 [Planctomycetota bacterium]
MSPSKPTAKKTATPAAQPAAERRAAEAELKRLVALFSPNQQKLAFAVRRWMQKRLKTAFELVYEYRDCFVVSFSPNAHGYQGVLVLRGSEDGVRLYLNRGKGLADPAKLLQGTGGLVRWIPVESAATLKRPEVVQLVDLAVAANEVPFPRTGKGPVILQSAPKKKPASKPAKDRSASKSAVRTKSSRSSAASPRARARG